MAPNSEALDRLKAQLAQLNGLIAEGVLTGDAALKRRDELERQIVAAVAGPAGPADVAAAAGAQVRAPRKLVAGIAVFVLAFGLAGYGWMGNRAAWSVGPGESGDNGEAAAAAADPASQQAQQAQVEAMVATLEEKLKSSPDDAEGWQMLARSYGVMGRHAEAASAHKRVVALKPQDAQALADYADAYAMANGKTLEGEPEKLIAQAVKLDPNNVKALALAGTVAFNRNEFNNAAVLWERAVAAAGPGSGYAQQLQGALAEARQRAGMPAPAVSASPAASAPASASASAPVGAAASASPGQAQAASVAGRVSLKAELKGRFGPDDTVFIFARAPTGSKMPLAILRKKVSDLPLDFKLDDSQAMSPAARLSSAAQVVVGARISKSGNAMPGPGDFQVISAPVATGAAGLQLEIGEPVQ